MTSADPFVIRDAVADDADQIAALHSRVWRKTYADLAPSVMFEGSMDDRRAAHWRSVLAPTGREDPSYEVAVAASPETIVGFISVGAPRSPAFGGHGEIKQLYVDQTAQRMGVGRQLLSDGARRLQSHGFTSVALAVVVGNDLALRFYKSAGGLDAGGFTDPGPLWPSENRLIVWDQIGDLF